MNQDPKMQGDPPPYSAGPPPPMGRPQAPGMTIIHTHIGPGIIPVVVGQQMGRKPTEMTCKYCNHEIVTRVELKPTLRTHLFAALLCLIGLWPCACVPYFVESCQNVEHYCPICNAYIGSYIN